MSFVSTSFFSVPVVPSTDQVAPGEEDSELSALLKQALASCAQLAQHNAKLEADNQGLQDKLAILNVSLLSDASIGLLRGKLLEQSREENAKLHKRVLELETLHRSTQYEAARDRRVAKDFQSKLAEHVKSQRDCEALSRARATAVERLDSELVQCKRMNQELEIELSSVEEWKQTLQDQTAKHELAQNQAQAQLQRERQYVEQLQDKLLAQGLDLRVLQSEFSPTPFKLSPTTPHSSNNNEVVVDRLRTQVAILEQELIKLRQQQRSPTHQSVEQLRHSLANAITELKPNSP
ncbi:hypothetical protein BASA81_001103 [Batrachochytrium salamandrivorans]|nr:hypothetical protein BASA81_001103 [Batrachochytrium salamandrivorans]